MFYEFSVIAKVWNFILCHHWWTYSSVWCQNNYTSFAFFSCKLVEVKLKTSITKLECAQNIHCRFERQKVCKHWMTSRQCLFAFEICLNLACGDFSFFMLLYCRVSSLPFCKIYWKVGLQGRVQKTSNTLESSLALKSKMRIYENYWTVFLKYNSGSFAAGFVLVWMQTNWGQTDRFDRVYLILKVTVGYGLPAVVIIHNRMFANLVLSLKAMNDFINDALDRR